jgi:hypothetical protein
MKRFLALAILGCSALVASRTDYLNAKRKFESIERFQTKPGSRVPLPSSELNAYVQVEIQTVAPQGVRDPKLELRGNNVAVGRAFINFLKLQKARGGAAPNWLMKKMLDGEHEVAVTARVDSGGGRATVYVQRVEISGVPVDGAALDFLIQNYLLPNYPDAKINRPFTLKYKMDHFEVNPGIAYVVMQK